MIIVSLWSAVCCITIIRCIVVHFKLTHCSFAFPLSLSLSLTTLNKDKKPYTHHSQLVGTWGQSALTCDLTRLGCFGCHMTYHVMMWSIKLFCDWREQFYKFRSISAQVGIISSYQHILLWHLPLSFFYLRNKVIYPQKRKSPFTFASYHIYFLRDHPISWVLTLALPGENLILLIIRLKF